MKNKSGFTLVELLAVVILIGVISVVTVPIVKNTIKDSKQKAYEKQINVILESAEDWATLNANLLPDSGSILVKMDTLKKEGLLENKKIINPIDKEEINSCVKITYNEDYNQYEYILADVCVEPDSLNALATTSSVVTSIPACLNDGTICSQGTPVAIKVNSNDIYNFYVLSETNNEVTLLMDRNLEGEIAWMSEEDYGCGVVGDNCSKNDQGPRTAVAALKTRTSGWTNIPEKVYTYSDDGGGNKYTAFTETMRARMLTLTEADKFKDASTDKVPSWMNINLKTTGGTANGYWLSAASDTDTNYARLVNYFAYIPRNYVYYNTSMNGVRPVITLKKQLNY